MLKYERLTEVFSIIYVRARVITQERLEQIMLQTQKQILRLLNARDERALRILSETSGRLLRSLARRILGSESDAEECVNDVLLEVWDTIPPESPESVSSYACMLTRRTAIDRMRLNTAQKRGGKDYQASLDELAEIPANEDSDELTCIIEEFLDSLSETDRMLFMGRYYGFEPVKSLSERLGLSTNAASLRLLRMREKLRTLLTERGIAI